MIFGLKLSCFLEKYHKDFSCIYKTETRITEKVTSAIGSGVIFLGRKSVLDGEDDDDEEVNTYDYDDSFLVDESASSSASYGQDSDESDWRPDNDDDDDNEVEEDVRELVAEARGFLRSKRR